ncbi:hypothetical protein K3152_13470 [Qipengyuania sp. 1NDH17]|uniref:Phage tail tape measure protein n=1 Tax=Qipengyuania polymorpha TaxID=2867234 RepID=A0ABS7J0B6_9SPHN|nr:hypothetical protein [Qipengyuania polymorpha]MBX7459257.1 hypothetical protein [Qipengyuania polymorpha]
MKKSERNMKRMGRDLQNIGKSLTVGLTAPIAGVALAFGRAAGTMAQESKSMANSARLAGEGFERFQRLAHAASVGVGINAEKLGDILKDTRDKIGDFASTGGGEMADFFENIAPKVNLTAEAFRGLSGKDALQLYYDSLSKAGVSQEQMVFYMESIADEASGLIPLLAESGREFDRLASKATIVSSSDAKQLEEYTEAQREMTSATRQLTIAFVNSGLLEGLTNIVTAIADFTSKLAKASPFAFQLAAGVGAALAVLGPLGIAVGGVTQIIAPAIAAFKTFGGMVTAAATASGSAIPILAGLKAAIGSVLATALPWIAALTVVAGVIYLVANRSKLHTDTAKKLAEQQAINKRVTDKLREATDNLATAHGEARKAALESARATYEMTKQERDAVWWKLQMAKAELRLAQIRTRTQRNATTGGVAGTAGFIQGLGDTEVGKARDLADGFAAQLEELNKDLADARKKITAPAPVNSYVPPSTSSGSATGSNARGSGRSKAEIEDQFKRDLGALYERTWSAMSAVATSAEERAELELRSVELARLQALKEIEANEDYNEAQKRELAGAVEFLADRERAAVEYQRMVELEREAADMAATRVDIERDKLDLQYSMANTQAERKLIAAEILALEQEYRRNQLEMVIASSTAADAEKRRAQAILDSLEAIEAGERAEDARRNETDAERYGREISKTGAQIGEELDRIKIRGLESLNDALTDAIVNFRNLRDTVSGVVKSILADLIRLQIQQAVIKPLAGAMGIPIPGFATGTSFAPGGMALVGERGPELVNLPRGSKVKTAGVTSAMLQGPMGQQSMRPIHMTVNTPDADSFRKSEGQIARELRRKLNGV